MIRLIAMLSFYAVAFVPGWFAFQELRQTFYELRGLQAHYSFAQEMTVRGHIFAALILMIVAMAIAWVGDRVSETKEERERMKRIRFEEHERELQNYMRPRPLLRR